MPRETTEDQSMIRPRFNMNIDLGHLMQAGTFVVLGMIYILTTRSQAEDANHKVDDLRSTVITQLTDVKAELKAQGTNIGNQLQILPDIAARLSLAERRQNGLEQDIKVLDGKIQIVGDRAMKAASDVDSMLRASDIPLGRRPK